MANLHGPSDPIDEAHLTLTAGGDARAALQTAIDAAVARGAKAFYIHGYPGNYLITRAAGVAENGEGFGVHCRSLVKIEQDDGMLFQAAAGQLVGDPAVPANRFNLFYVDSPTRFRAKLRGDGNGANQTWTTTAKDSLKLLYVSSLNGDAGSQGPLDFDLEADNFRGMALDVRGDQTRVHNLVGSVTLRFKGQNNGGDVQFSRIRSILFERFDAITDDAAGWRASNAGECANCGRVDYAHVFVREKNGKRMVAGGGGLDHGGTEFVLYGDVRIAEQVYGIKGNTQWNSERRITRVATGHGVQIDNCAVGYYGIPDGRLTFTGAIITNCTANVVGWCEDAVVLPAGLAASATAGKFKTTATAQYVANHTAVTKTPADNLTFTFVTTIAAGKWGTVLVQANAAGTVTTVAETTQAYNSSDEAVRARRGDAGFAQCELGYLLIHAGAAPWVANTSNLTSDPASVAFVDTQPDDQVADFTGLITTGSDQGFNLSGKTKVIGTGLDLHSFGYTLQIDRFMSGVGYSPVGTPWVEFLRSTLRSDIQTTMLLRGDNTDSWSPVVLLDDVRAPFGSGQLSPVTAQGGTKNFVSVNGRLQGIVELWLQGLNIYQTNTLTEDNRARISGDPVKNWVEWTNGVHVFQAPSDGARAVLDADRRHFAGNGTTSNLVATNLLTATCSVLTRVQWTPFAVQACWSTSSNPGPEDVYLANGSGGILAIQTSSGLNTVGQPAVYDQVVGFGTNGASNGLSLYDYRGLALAVAGTLNPVAPNNNLWLFSLRNLAAYPCPASTGIRAVMYAPGVKFTSDEAKNGAALLLRA